VKETGKVGVRYDAQLTGEAYSPEVLESGLKQVAEFRRGMRTQEGWKQYKYLSPEEFIVNEGKAYEVPDKPPQITLMTPKECYRNSAMMVIKHPEKYDYVEGVYASPDLPIQIEHAWLVDKETGKVVDPTLGWRPKAAYHGVRFDRQFLVRKMVQNGYYGIMSNGFEINDVVLGKDKDFKYAK
jgi:hypothetical protein